MLPIVSVVLPVKNGLPHVRSAIEAVARQTYRRFELVVQDGGSTDGTLEYLQSLDGIPGFAVESAPDSGIGQAYGRALKRSAGDLICFAATDETLADDALERGVEAIAARRDAVLVNGSVSMLDSEGRAFEVFPSPHFDLLRHMHCEVVLPFAGLLNRRVAGDQLFYDESLKTCPDYDFWIRLGSRFASEQFVVMDAMFKSARADRTSMSFRAESFEQFCRDKVFILNRYLDSQPASPALAALRRSATSGIYLWAAESIRAIQGPSSAFMRWCHEAARFDPWSPRLAALAVRTEAFTIDSRTGHLVLAPARQPARPVGPTTTVSGLSLDRMFTLPHWEGASIAAGPTYRVRTGADAWSYAAQIPLALDGAMAADSWYWACLDVRVLEGRVGIGALVGNDLLDEQTLTPSSEPVTVYLRLTHPQTTGIVVRNGGLAAPSSLEIMSASIASTRKPV